MLPLYNYRAVSNLVDIIGRYLSVVHGHRLQFQMKDDRSIRTWVIPCEDNRLQTPLHVPHRASINRHVWRIRDTT